MVGSRRRRRRGRSESSGSSGTSPAVSDEEDDDDDYSDKPPKKRQRTPSPSSNHDHHSHNHHHRQQQQQNLYASQVQGFFSVAARYLGELQQLPRGLFFFALAPSECLVGWTDAWTFSSSDVLAVTLGYSVHPGTAVY